MALGNGVLVHGPSAWACAVRTTDGELKVVARRKGLRAAAVTNPLLRGPARLFETFALLPQLKRELPEATLPFERPRVVAAMAAGTVVVAVAKRSRLNPIARETLGALVSFAPAILALRGGELAEYHGAEHMSIGRYEHGEDRPKEHERCGSHLVGPLVLTTIVGNVAAERAPARYRRTARLLAGVGAMSASVELFAWMTRHPENPVACALAWPGYELQHGFGTREPSARQLEVADAALNACLELER
jgi:uncharacterized protein YqhQ